MGFGAHSRLRKLPNNLDPVQALFLDGIRYSVETIDLAYQRLVESLKRVSEAHEAPEEGKGILGELGPGAFLDAWSIVDNGHRLRELLLNMNGIKKTPALVVFRDHKLQELEPLRNGIQHLNQEVKSLLEKKQPVWGYLSWVSIVSVDPLTVNSFVWVPGAIRSGTRDLINPASLGAIEPPLDEVRLTAFDQTARLSDTHRRVGRFAKDLQDKLAGLFEAHPESSGSDLLTSAQMLMTEVPKGT